MKEFIFNSITDLIKKPLVSISILGNLFLIESILSIDNAVMIASMVMGLKKKDRKRALKYGIFGAYFLRVTVLIFSSILIKVWWLKTLGGLYLILIGLNHFFSKNKYENKFKKKITLQDSFWRVLISIGIMDLAFSIDNIFSAVSLSENFILILLGVFIGILTMRFTSQGLVKIMEIYPFMKDSAFSVVILLGIKLISSIFFEFEKEYSSLESIFSFIAMALFFFPIFILWIKNKKKSN